LTTITENSVNNISDSELVALCRSGDAVFFKKLYERYIGRVYGFALRLSGNTDLADDLTQEVFIKIWENIGAFKGDSALYSWIHKICVNAFLMKLRADKNYEKKINKGYDESLIISYPGDDFSIDMEKAVQKLPPQAKMVFILFEIENYKHKEISEMLGIEEGTSKAHLHKARKILREELVK